MSEHQDRGPAMPEMDPLYIGGYFTDRMDAGERPRYGYPHNHLPEVKDEPMEVQTCFVAARKQK